MQQYKSDSDQPIRPQSFDLLPLRAGGTHLGWLAQLQPVVKQSSLEAQAIAFLAVDSDVIDFAAAADTALQFEFDALANALTVVGVSAFEQKGGLVVEADAAAVV